MRLISPTYRPPVALALRLLPLTLAAAVILPAFAPAVADAGKASPGHSVRRTPVVEAIEKGSDDWFFDHDHKNFVAEEIEK